MINASLAKMDLDCNKELISAVNNNVKIASIKFAFNAIIKLLILLKMGLLNAYFNVKNNKIKKKNYIFQKKNKKI